MRQIQPIIITDDEFTSSNITEADESVWSDVTAYVAGDKVMVLLAEGVSYHMIYECVTGNTDKFPPDNLSGDPIYWKQLYRTNRWRMWDDKSRSASTRSDSIVVRLTPGVIYNATALLNVVTDSINVRVNDPTAGDVYDEDIDMLDLAGIDDFYPWFFSPLKKKDNIALFDLPAYPNAYIEITLTNTGETVELGEWVVGNLKELGSAAYPYKVQIDNYSTKQTDPGDGYPIIDPKLYLKIASYNYVIDGNKVGDIQETLGLYLNTPAVYVGYLDDAAASNEGIGQETIIFGYIKSASIKVSGVGVNNAAGSLKIEELS